MGDRDLFFAGHSMSTMSSARVEEPNADLSSSCHITFLDSVDSKSH
jgi:hypothetical protein